MFDVLKIIIILVVFGFMVLSFKENHRRHKERMHEIKKELEEKGKLPSRKKMFSTFFLVIGLMFVIPVIVTLIIIYYVRKVEFSASIFFSGIGVFFIIEMIIGSIIYIIQDFVRDSKSVGVRKAGISFLITIVFVAVYLYIKYNW